METGKKALLHALLSSEIPIISSNGKFIHLPHKMTIEVEGPSLFKLSEDGFVVAPFGSVDELTRFIQMNWAHKGLK